MEISATDLAGFGNERGSRLHRSIAAGTARKFLVFVRSGPSPVEQPKWALDSPNRKFDIMANFFAPPARECWLLERADYVASGGLSKFHAAKLLLAEALIAEYAGVFFLDDDIVTHFDPGDFAEFAQQYDIALAQAALTHDSVWGHAVSLLHPSCAWRETNFVEVMAPYFCRKLLSMAIDRFDRSISGWGLDVDWGSRYASSHRIAVIDSFTMSHVRRSNTADGAYYRYLRSIGVDHMRELTAIYRELGIDKFDIVTRKLVFRQDGIHLRT